MPPTIVIPIRDTNDESMNGYIDSLLFKLGKALDAITDEFPVIIGTVEYHDK